MANRFQHLIPAGQGTEAKPQNRFAHLIPKGEPLSPKSNRELSGTDQALDAVQSLGMGVNKGIIALAGMPGDIADLTRRGVEFGADKLGFNGEKAGKVFSKINPTSYLPRADQIQAAIETKTGKFPEPRTSVGDYAETVGEFAPAALAGPGGIIRKGAEVLVPALASEAAGKAFEGSRYEPLARVGGALVGGKIANVRKGTDIVKQVAKDAPTHAAVKQQTNALYGRLKKAGIKYDSGDYDVMATDLARTLKDEGFRAAQAPMAADALAAVGEHVGKSIEYADFESVRKVASKILREKNATDTDKAAAGLIIDALDSFAGSAKYIHNGTAPNASGLMKQARETARRNIIGKQIEDMLDKAETYQSGVQSGLQNQFSSYLKSNKAKGLSETEKVAFKQVAKGNFNRNVLTHLGRFGIDPSKLGNIATLIPAAGAGAAYYSGDPTSAAAILALGTGAKFAGRRMTQKSAARAKAVVLAGRKAQGEAGKAVTQNRIEANVRTLANSENAYQQGKDKPLKPIRLPDGSTLWNPTLEDYRQYGLTP